MNENGEGIFVVGQGVSEINYVDEDGVEVETRITSPNGRTVMSGAFGLVSAQSDARLSFDWSDIGNFSFTVTRFPMCSDGTWSGGDDGILLRHGYNSGGGIWWRPTGFQRCPRNPVVISDWFPIDIALDAYEWESETFIGGNFGYGICEYAPTCTGRCTIDPYVVHKTGPNIICSNIYAQCRTLVWRGRCRNRAKVCLTGNTPGRCT